MEARRKVFAKLALFVLGPLILAEPVVRLGHSSLYQRFEDSLAADQVQMILVGSSRVAAAIDADQLSEEFSRYYHKKVGVVNLGRGYSRPHDRYFAFRNLFQKYSQHLRGAWLLIEAPQGVPDLAGWDSPWAIEEEPGLIASFLGVKDFFKMLSESRTPRSLCLELGLYRFSRAALAVRKMRDRITIFGQTWGRDSLVAVEKQNADGEHTTDFLGRGGILNGSVGAQEPKSQNPASHQGIVTSGAEGRTANLQGGDTQNENSRGKHTPGKVVAEVVEKPGVKPQVMQYSETIPIVPVEGAVWLSVIELANQYDMHVAFFEPPMSQGDSATMRSTIHRKSFESFQQMAAERRWTVVKARANFPDTDFPDQLHLSPAKTPEFTRSFAQRFEEGEPHAF